MARGEDTGSHAGRQVGRSAHEDRQIEQHAKSMGVPKEWVTGPSSASFTGSVIGHTGSVDSTSGELWMTAESTGGGSSDSHRIPFAHPLMEGGSSGKFAFNKHFGVNENNPKSGKKWTATGTQQWDPKLQANKMSWTLSPYKADTE